MKITLGKLKTLIREAFGTHTTYIPTGKDIKLKKSEIKYGAKPEDERVFHDETFDLEVKELSEMPEFVSVEAFAESKIDDDDYTFSATELNALVLGIYGSTGEGVSLKDIKQELISIGLKFQPREPSKHVRGFGSPVHGSNRYAGNAAGSGMGMGREGPVGFGMGGGVGSMGGKYNWDADSKKNLPMGSKRR